MNLHYLDASWKAYTGKNMAFLYAFFSTTGAREIKAPTGAREIKAPHPWQREVTSQHAGHWREVEIELKSLLAKLRISWFTLLAGSALPHLPTLNFGKIYRTVPAIQQCGRPGHNNDKVELNRSLQPILDFPLWKNVNPCALTHVIQVFSDLNLIASNAAKCLRICLQKAKE